MKDAPAFDFYPERWLTGTALLTDAEQLSYLRLLCHQWLLEGLPAETPALRRLAGKGVTPALLEKFPVGEDGRRRNARLEAIREAQRGRIAKKSEQRRAAAMRRWHPEGANGMREQCDRIPPAYAGDLREQCPPPTTHPIPEERETRAHAGAAPAQPPAGVSTDIDPTRELEGHVGCEAVRIAGLYPANGNIYEAARAILRSIRGGYPNTRGAEIAEIGARVERHAAAFRALPAQARRFCPQRLAYFTDERWRDDPTIEPWVYHPTGSEAAAAPAVAAGPAMTKDWNGGSPV